MRSMMITGAMPPAALMTAGPDIRATSASI
jgi:hypothetical protein